MKSLIKEAGGVADAFFDLTKAIRSRSVLGMKNNELVLLGILTSHGTVKGLETHINRAIDNGANHDEIISAIILALPVVGIGKVNLALGVVHDVYELRGKGEKQE